MRVLVVVSGNHKQVAPFVLEQAEALRKAGCEVELFCVTGHGILGYLRNVKHLKAAIHRFQPDIVHAHYGLCGLLCTLQHKVPVVVTYHGSDINNPTMFRFGRVAMRRAAYNIFVSKKLREKSLEVSKSRSLEVFSSVIPCGIDTSIFHSMNREEAYQFVGLDPTKHYILFAGAFDNEVKNPELAKEAFSLLTSSLTDDITGSQSEQKRTEKNLDVTSNSQSDCKRFEKNSDDTFFSQSELKRTEKNLVATNKSQSDCKRFEKNSDDTIISQSEQKRTEKNLDITSKSESDCKRFEKNSVFLLELKGYSRAEVAVLMNAVDCLLMTSHSEGSPQVIKEALACGCPIVSVDVGDVKERIEGVAGCHVAASREPEELSALLEKTIHNSESRIPNQRVELDNIQIASQIINIYKKIIN